VKWNGTVESQLPATLEIENAQNDFSAKKQLSLRKSLIVNTWEGSFATVFIVLTGGAFLTGLALHFGASDFEIGLLAAVPFIAQLAQLVSAYLVDITGKRKQITVWSIGIARQAWLLLVPLPFLTGNWRLGALIAIAVVSNIAGMVATAGWNSWMADLVPGRLRGRYFGNRNATIAIVSITATLAGGIILDHFKAIGIPGAGFCIILAVGCIFALAALFLLKRLPEKPICPNKNGINWALLLEPLKNKAFMHLIWIYLAWNFAVGISAAFFAAHMITFLKMSFFQISVYACIGALAAVLLNRRWGVMVDHFGCKPVIAFCAFGISLVPLIWWIPRPEHLWILIFEAIYSGALWTGFALAAFNIPIANSPRENRTIYLAMFSVLPGISFFVSSILGGILAESWKNIHWVLGPQTIINYHILFAISSVLRLSAAFLMLTFHEPREKGLPDMVQFMGDTFMKRLYASRQFFPWPTK
jgi:MFS family permease